MRTAAALMLVLLASLAPTGAGSQRAPDIDVRHLALTWARGEYRAPLTCDIDGAPRRGLRRVIVSAGPRHTREPSNRLSLFDLEVPEGTRCYTETGQVEPNAIGSIYFSLEGYTRPDTAQHDFQAELRREGGFDFSVRKGRLRLGPASEAPETLPEVDFAGGRLKISRVKPHTDAFRRLAGYGAPRMLLLRLEAPDGTRVDLDLIQSGAR